VRMWDTSVEIMTGYDLDDSGLCPGRDKSFSLLHSIQTGCGAHLASYLMGTACSFLKGKAAGP
jgi:hypothetical protein